MSATYEYSIDDTNGSTSAVTGSGTIAGATDTISGIDLSSLDDGTITLSVTLTDTVGNEGSAAIDTATKNTASAGGGGSTTLYYQGASTSDVTPPIITNVRVNTSTVGNVLITWDTDEDSSSQVKFGQSVNLGYQTHESDTTPRVSSHLVTIPASFCRISAYFSVFSADAAGNTGISPGHRFNTGDCLTSAADPLVPPAPQSPLSPVPTPTTAVISESNADESPEQSSGFSEEPDVIVNNDKPVSSTNIVPVTLIPTPDTVAVVIWNPELNTQKITLPVTDTSISVDLCRELSACDDGEYALAFYFITKYGSHTETIEKNVKLQKASEQEVLADILPLGQEDFQIPAYLSALSQLIAMAGLAILAIQMLSSFIATLRSLTDIPLLLARAIGTLSGAGFVHKRQSHTWGTVYDSITRRPLDPAVVTVYDENGKEVKTAITDLDGRYAFLLPEGTYTLKAEKGHHSFPARNVPAIDPVYTQPYVGGPIHLMEGQVLTRDVPLDPTEYDWNEDQKYAHGYYRFYSHFDRPFAYISLFMTGIGAICAVLSVIFNPTLFNICLFILYLAVITYWVLAGVPRISGTVRNAKGKPLPLALIRAKYYGTDAWGPHTVTDHLGRYYLLLPPGRTFDISIETQSGPDSYAPIWQGTVETENGYLNKTLRV